MPKTEFSRLQQYLPFTVLKQVDMSKPAYQRHYMAVATVLTVYGIETLLYRHRSPSQQLSCNSTYRLRY